MDRNVQPQNLLLTGPLPGGQILLCDFGISRLISPDAEVREINGTPDYVAPEVLQFDPISLKTDMWSLGVLTYVLLTGYSPFGANEEDDDDHGDAIVVPNGVEDVENRQNRPSTGQQQLDKKEDKKLQQKLQQYCNITTAVLDFPDALFGAISAEAQDFIAKLIVKDPKRRMDTDECLHHPWLSCTALWIYPVSLTFPSVSPSLRVRASPAKLCFTDPVCWHFIFFLFLYFTTHCNTTSLYFHWNPNIACKQRQPQSQLQTSSAIELQQL